MASLCPPHLLLRSYPLGVGGFFVTLHADSIELHHALCQRDEAQDVSKWLQEYKGQQNSNHFHWMDGGIITLQEQNRRSIVWNNKDTERPVIVLLMQIVQSFKNVSCVAHVVVSTGPFCVQHTVSACQY